MPVETTLDGEWGVIADVSYREPRCAAVTFDTPSRQRYTREVRHSRHKRSATSAGLHGRRQKRNVW